MLSISNFRPYALQDMAHGMKMPDPLPLLSDPHISPTDTADQDTDDTYRLKHGFPSLS